MSNPTPRPTIQGVAVTLTREEMHHAALAGVLRRLESAQKQHKNASKPRLDLWGMDIEAAAAEIAAARVTGKYWHIATGRHHAPDVGNAHVRYTPHNDGGLYLRPSDPENEVFILVTGGMGEYHVRGYLNSSDFMRREFWRNDETATGGGFYLIPQAKLTPIRWNI